jgi:carboxypeptidase C (cathepsin A)
MFTRVKDAEKALAHCQLLQLAKHYNKCDQHEIKSFYYVASYYVETKSIQPFGLTGENVYGGQVKFINETDLNKCIQDNRDLWEIYLGVK